MIDKFLGRHELPNMTLGVPTLRSSVAPGKASRASMPPASRGGGPPLGRWHLSHFQRESPLPESTARLLLLSKLVIKGFEPFVPMFAKFPSSKTGRGNGEKGGE